MSFEPTHTFVPGPETAAVMRRRALTSILARHEAERIGLVVSAESVAQVTRWYRARFELLKRSDVDDFLTFAGIDHADFSKVMRSFATIDELELHHQARIQTEIPAYRAVLSAREWRLRREDG
jgi:hypothetical protein